MGRPRECADDKFWAKVDRSGPNECWEWRAGTDKDGYGKFSYITDEYVEKWNHCRQVHIRAHRWSYQRFVGPIPEGLCVLHECDNPPCVNPAHLRVGTPKENNDDKISKGRAPRLWGMPLNRSRQTHCKHDHPLSGDNLYLDPNGHRQCRACRRMVSLRAYYRKKASA